MSIIIKRSGLILVLLVSRLFSYAQTPAASKDSIRTSEMQLKQFSDSIARGSTDKVRLMSVAVFNPAFMDLLNNPATFNYAFDSLPTVSKLLSPDGLFRVYTWLRPAIENGVFTYYGIIQRINPVSKQIKVIGLIDYSRDTTGEDYNELRPETWYGAVYYEIIEKKINKKTHYFLLGWKGNDRLSTKKVIDVVYFDEWDNVTFGAPLFTDAAKKKKNRMVFEYNAQAVMLLRYDKKKKMIVFDHLSPSSPSAKGQYQYYGPDFTYDGIQFKKGIWNYKSNLDLRNPGDRK